MHRLLIGLPIALVLSACGGTAAQEAPTTPAAPTSSASTPAPSQSASPEQSDLSDLDLDGFLDPTLEIYPAIDAGVLALAGVLEAGDYEYDRIDKGACVRASEELLDLYDRAVALPPSGDAALDELWADMNAELVQPALFATGACGNVDGLWSEYMGEDPVGSVMALLPGLLSAASPLAEAHAAVGEYLVAAYGLSEEGP